MIYGDASTRSGPARSREGSGVTLHDLIEKICRWKLLGKGDSCRCSKPLPNVMVDCCWSDKDELNDD